MILNLNLIKKSDFGLLDYQAFLNNSLEKLSSEQKQHKQIKKPKKLQTFDNLFTNINKLYNVGLELNINGDRVKYYGLLAFGLGDTPALNW